MLKIPAKQSAALVTLAVAIAANTTIFAFVEALIINPTPYPKSVATIWETNHHRNQTRNIVSPANYLDWIQRTHTLTNLALYLPTRTTLGATPPEQLKAEKTTASYFTLLAAAPQIGRTFTEADDKPSAPPVVILSHTLWTTKFAANKAIIGETIRLDDKPVTIIGVMPPNFQPLSASADLWMPLALDPSANYRLTAGRHFFCAGRLTTTLDTAQKELTAIAETLAIEHPHFNQGWGINVIPLNESISGDWKLPLFTLMAAVSFILLIACANVANLLLAKATQRRKEMAIRASLGATHVTLIRQLLTESLMLSFTAAIVGTAIATMSLKAASKLTMLPNTANISLNPTTLLFTVAIATISAVLFGITPALQLASTPLASTLKQTSRGGIGTHGANRARNALIIIEVALSVILLSASALFIQSFRKLTTVHPGFEATNLHTFSVNLASTRYRDSQIAVRTLHEITSELQSLPKIDSAAYTVFLPFSGPGTAATFYDASHPKPEPGRAPIADIRTAHPNYFQTMRIPLLRGRTFQDDDFHSDAPLRVIVNATLARQIKGQRLIAALGNEKPAEIIGVVGDTKHLSLQDSPRPMIYLPRSRFAPPFATFVVRSTLPAEIIRNAAISTLQHVDPTLPVYDMKTMDQWMAASTARPRVQMHLLAVMAAIALLLASTGIYSVISFLVSLRTQEIGLRLALGASRHATLSLVLGQALQPAALGLLIGLPAALILTRFLTSLLYGIQPSDPVTYIAVTFLMLFVSALAALIPAFRAAAIQPLSALRHE